MKPLVKLILIFLAAGIGLGVAGLILSNQSHRDVVNTPADFGAEVDPFVAEYLKDPAAANDKYLSKDGDSRIIAMTGIIDKISLSGRGDQIVMLKGNTAKADIQCLFASGHNIGRATKGDKVTIKGVLRSGPEYDEDLGMYEPAYLEECSIPQ